MGSIYVEKCCMLILFSVNNKINQITARFYQLKNSIIQIKPSNICLNKKKNRAISMHGQYRFVFRKMQSALFPSAFKYMWILEDIVYGYECVHICAFLHMCVCRHV